jgi:hypothetical protein
MLAVWSLQENNSACGTDAKGGLSCCGPLPSRINCEKIMRSFIRVSPCYVGGIPLPFCSKLSPGNLAILQDSFILCYLVVTVEIIDFLDFG